MDDLIKAILIAGGAGLLIVFLVNGSSKSNAFNKKTNLQVIEKNTFERPTTEPLFDKWAVKLTIGGFILGIFATLSQGYNQIGFMIGFGIPFGLIGFVVGIVIDSFRKPKANVHREKNRTSSRDFTQHDPSVLKNRVSPMPTIKVPERHIPVPTLSDPELVERRSAADARQSETQKVESAPTERMSHSPHVKGWYESEFGIGQKTSDLYLMNYEVRRQSTPEAGYQVLYSHPRKEGQQVPRFIHASEIDKPQILGQTMTSLCPVCNTRCSAQRDPVSYFECRECKFTWWQRK